MRDVRFSPGALKALGLTAQDLEALPESQKKKLDQMRPGTTYWKDAMRRFRQNRLAMFAVYALLFIMLASIFLPIIYQYDYAAQDFESIHLHPTPAHPLGTDKLGRDILVRLMIGTRISLAIGVVTSLVVMLVGTLYGGLSAYLGGWVDQTMMAIVDLLMAIPSMLIIILLSVSLKGPISSMMAAGGFFANISRMGAGLISIFIILVLFNWLGMARAVRGAILMNRRAEYVLAAEMAGAKPLRIIRRHLLPNAMSVVLISATSVVPSAIITESFLSFIGLGVTAPMASLGSMASDALSGMRSHPLYLIAPALIISLIILCFNLLGDGLRDALDPRLRT